MFIFLIIIMPFVISFMMVVVYCALGIFSKDQKSEDEKGVKMRLKIVVDIDIEESGLIEDEVKDNIIQFTKDLLILGADKQRIGLTLKEVDYSNEIES